MPITTTTYWAQHELHEIAMITITYWAQHNYMRKQCHWSQQHTRHNMNYMR